MKEVKPRKRKTERSNFKENSDNEEENTSSRLGPSRLVSSGSYIFTFILIIVTLLIYDITFISQETINIEAIKTDLLSNVHNQNESVYLILDSLNEMLNHEQQTQIINFIGSTGVGKTFIANLLKKHFYSVLELNGISYYDNARQNVINKLKYSNSAYNLIIIEDLTESDVDNLLILLKQVPQDLGAFVICIFNIQETDGELNHNINYSLVERIIKKFSNAEVLHKVAKFHEFDRNQAREWVIHQLTKQGINIDDNSQIVDTVLNDQDITYHGLKGLSSKINLEL